MDREFEVHRYTERLWFNIEVYIYESLDFIWHIYIYVYVYIHIYIP